jgi:hypothetical protein
MMRNAPLLLAAALSLLPSRPANACSCKSPGVKVFPESAEEAPTDTHVWLFDQTLSLAEEGVALSGPDGEIEVERRSLVSGKVRVIELIPKKPLAPKTKYSVAYTLKGENRKAALSTGAGPDAKSPLFDGVEKTFYVKRPKVCCDCSTGDPFIDLKLKAASDDNTPGETMLYAIWLPGEDGQIDYSAPPTAYAVAYPAWSDAAFLGSYLTLGHPSICSADNFTLPKSGRKLRLGVAAIDRAGNASAGHEATISFGKVYTGSYR